MPDDETHRLLNEIGRLLAEDTDHPLDHTLLYAELDRNFVAPSIFKDLDHALYRPPDLDVVGDALLELWESQTSERRWVAIENVVRGDKFTASFTYPEEIDPNELSLDRRERIVAKHFGKKPIIYPPMPDDPDIMAYRS